MVAARSLTVGRCYFIVMFDDESLTEPIVQTLRFARVEIRENGTKIYLFQELGHDHATDLFFVNDTDLDHLVLDSDGLIDKLRRAFAGQLSKG